MDLKKTCLVELKQSGKLPILIHSLHNKIERMKDMFNKFFKRALTLYELGCYDRAIENFNTAHRINPNYVDLYLSRARTYMKKNDYERAITDYSKALEINPNIMEAILYRSFCFGKLSEICPEIVIDKIENLIEKQPNNYRLYCDRASFAEKNSNIKEAIKDYSLAIRLGPEPQMHIYENRARLFIEI